MKWLPLPVTVSINVLHLACCYATSACSIGCALMIVAATSSLSLGQSAERGDRTEEASQEQTVKEDSAEEVFSGPQVGEPLPPLPLKVLQSKEAKTDSLDLVEAAQGKPLVVVFMSKRTRPGFALVRALATYCQSREKDQLEFGIVLLHQDQTELQQWFGNVKQNFPTDILFLTSEEGEEGPGSYGLNRDVAITVLVAKEGKVTANFALIDPSVQVDLPLIGKKIVELIGGDVPKASVPERSMNRVDSRQAEIDATMRKYLGPLIQKDNSDEQTAEAIDKIDALVAEKPEFKKEIGSRAKRIVDAGVLQNYGTEKAQQQLKIWAEEWTK